MLYKKKLRSYRLVGKYEGIILVHATTEEYCNVWHK